MPYCGECGKKYKDSLKFCPACGTPNPHYKEAKIDKPDTPKDQNINKTVKRGENFYGKINLEDLPKGFVIDERYDVKEKLGQGGFGAVYWVYDRELETNKALKVIPEAIVNDKEAMFDLRREAKTMISLNHKNIVRVYDFHRKGKIKYIDMEYIDGKTLTDIKLEYSNKQVPEKEVKEYAIKIAEGLAFAHSKNVIHKDIKPQNVMVMKDNEVKLMDFGIAETVRTSMSRIRNSSSSGTLVYMSPEQLKGKNVGIESDIYSFGAMLYELLCGHPPFYRGDINYQILNEQPKKLDFIPDSFNKLIIKCLEKNYKSRVDNFHIIIEKLKSNFEYEKQIDSKKKDTGVKKKHKDNESKTENHDSKINELYKKAHRFYYEISKSKKKKLREAYIDLRKAKENNDQRKIRNAKNRIEEIEGAVNGTIRIRKQKSTTKKKQKNATKKQSYDETKSDKRAKIFGIFFGIFVSIGLVGVGISGLSQGDASALLAIIGGIFVFIGLFKGWWWN